MGGGEVPGKPAKARSIRLCRSLNRTVCGAGAASSIASTILWLSSRLQEPSVLHESSWCPGIE
jgi:hypothetical protein